MIFQYLTVPLVEISNDALKRFNMSLDFGAKVTTSLL